MLEHPVQPELVSTGQPSNPTPTSGKAGPDRRRRSGARRAARHRTVATPSRSPTDHLMRRTAEGPLMMASGRTRLARIGRTTDGSQGPRPRPGLARTSSATTRVETTRSTTRAATGTRKAAAAAAAGGVVGIARTGVTAVVAAILERYDEPVISEDDVLVPARGILDVLDNYAFVRTNGYLPGPTTRTSPFDGQEARLA